MPRHMARTVAAALMLYYSHQTQRNRQPEKVSDAIMPARPMPDRTIDAVYEPFRPALHERFLVRFHQAARRVAHATADDREPIIRSEVEWALGSQGNARQQAIYQAVWLVLRDLLRVGWTPRWNDETATFEVSPPSPDVTARDPAAIRQHKQGRRAIMAHERHARLVQAAEFIRRMEQPPHGAPITALIADGAHLASELRAIAALPHGTARDAALRTCIRPYLQLVEEGARCAFTGLLLSDVWRYLRLTWASPAYTTPGRSLFYLVRDAARPNHPIMGIASLENAPIFIGDRDHHLGWTPDAFLRTLLPQPAGSLPEAASETAIRDAFQHLLHHIHRAITDIDATGLCTPDALAHPDPALVQHLTGLALRFGRERQDALREWKQHTSRDAQPAVTELRRSEYGNISEQAYTLLFLKKRAAELSRLLGARIALTQLLEHTDFMQRWQSWAASERGRSAIRTGLIAIKNCHVGTSILELNVCGAIPPYNHLLAGKLTTLLVCSPQVAADYRRRYGAARSEIASQLKGATVVRPAELVYIGTTALYTAGSSQYNRLRLPAGLLRVDAPEMRFEQIGMTLGYGTSHISDATTVALELTSSDGFVEVNHVLGEGISPKMRIIRHGLDAIFRGGSRTLADRVAQHQMRRLIYGVMLAEHGHAYLNGKTDQPRYLWDDHLDPIDGTERIAEFWRTRWLRARIDYTPALEQISTSTTQDIVLSRVFSTGTAHDWAYPLIRRKRELAAMQPPPPDDHQRHLIRSLYRGATGFADDVSIDDLRRLHAITDLDHAVRTHISQRRSVVLTGNPGDGKTHLLRILADGIAALGAEIERDASAVPNDVIVARWRAAHDAGKPYFIAINESVLFQLAATYPEFHVLRSACHQVTGAVGYGAVPSPALDDVVVLDLSHRNTLDERLVRAVINTLTDTTTLPRCAQCPMTGCDMVRNQALLRHPRVRARLQAIFDRITRRGIHVTMRDLQGFIAYLIIGDRNCTQLSQQSDEPEYALPQLIYRGQGPLFDALRTVFDPAYVSHPVYDDHLLNNTIDPVGWLNSDVSSAGSLDSHSIKQFMQRKRAFYFFHQQGDVLLTSTGDDEQAFTAFLANSNQRTAKREIIRKINAFFGQRAEFDRFPVWQSHRYDQSAQRILYAVQYRKNDEFELFPPILVSHMAEAFQLADNHRIMRLKSNPRAMLRIDATLFRLLHHAEHGLPALLLQPEASRRIWQFLEQLTDTTIVADGEVTAQILDPTTGEQLAVTIDPQERIYLAIQRTDKDGRRV